MGLEQHYLITGMDGETRGLLERDRKKESDMKLPKLGEKSQNVEIFNCQYGYI